MDTTPDFSEPLAHKLQRIEELADKLLYVKWGQDFLVLLQRATHDLLELASTAPQHAHLVRLAQPLVEQLDAYLDEGVLPKGAKRDRLIHTLTALCRMAIPTDPHTTAPHRVPDRPPLLWWIGTPPATDLVRRLEQRGGVTMRLLPDVPHMRAKLVENHPDAVLIDLEGFPDDPHVRQQIAEIRPLLPTEAPLFFLSERGDMAARLDAIDLGSAGYCTKPIDVVALLDALNPWLLKNLNDRVLIVDADLTAAREIAALLGKRGMATQVLAQPLRILQVLSQFRPSLLILSLDLAAMEMDGVLLAKALQQHEVFRNIPLILISAQPKMGHRLAAAGVGGETLLDRPPSPELLLATVTKRLRQGRGLHHTLNELSHQDTVSGLFNRPYFLAALSRALQAATPNTPSIAVVLIALDNLRTFESHDVSMADEVIEQAARCTQNTLGAGPTIARFGDALFAVLMESADQESLLATAHTLQSALEAIEYPIANNPTRLRTSIGMTVAAPGVQEAATVIQQADVARDMAHRSQESRIHIHHARSRHTDSDTSRHGQLLEQVREAVQQQRMNLLFQPIVSLRGDTTHRYEVLLRMRNQEGWEILPETVFGLVKRHRIGMVLDRWVIAHAIRLLRDRRARGQSTVLFINISPTILQDPEMINWLQGGLQKTGVPGEQLVFEMIESTAAVNQSMLQPFLAKLKGLGCGISIDHFSGHEKALELVRALGVDYIKLGASFTQKLADDTEHQKQLSRIVRTLAGNGVTTIITGVEDAASLPVLWACGIDYVQGFFLQRPHTDMAYDFDQVIL